jgi:geranylgeranylglycerol-phosphate geranylgeranyltransferase
LKKTNKTSSSVYAYIKIIRPLNCVFGSLTVIIGIFNAYRDLEFFRHWENLVKLFLGPLIYMLIAAASNVINDVFDLDIDKINRPERAIPSGKIQKKTAILYSIILASLGILISIFIAFLTPNVVIIPIITLFFTLIGYLYSWKGKRHGFIGNIMVGLSFSFGLPFGAMLFVPFLTIPPHLWFFFATAMCLLISRELIKGMEDIEGDAKFHLKTVAIIKGFKFTTWLSIVFSLLAIVTFTLPSLLYSLNLGFVMLLVIGNVFVLASIIFLIQGLDRKENHTKASLCLKIGAYIGLIAYISAIF